jgi:hypothetical protein
MDAPLDGTYRARIELTYSAEHPDAGVWFVTRYVLPHLRAHPDFQDWSWIDTRGPDGWWPFPQRIGPRPAAWVDFPAAGVERWSDRRERADV